MDNSAKKEKEKGKAIALQVDDSDEHNTSSSDGDCDEAVMLSKRLGNLLRKKNQRYKKSKNYKFQTKKFPTGEGIICYYCKKPGHIRGDCPELVESKKKEIDVNKRKNMKEKKYHKKKKTVLWVNPDSNESSTSSLDEEVNMSYGKWRILKRFTGSSWGSFLHGWGNLLCMFIFNSIGRTNFIAATLGYFSWLGMTLWKDSVAYGYSSPMKSLMELIS